MFYRKAENLYSLQIPGLMTREIAREFQEIDPALIQRRVPFSEERIHARLANEYCIPILGYHSFRP